MLTINVVATGDTVHISFAGVGVGLSADNAETLAMMLLREAHKAKQKEQPPKFVPYNRVVRE